jgi:hypothetical protein
MEQTTHLSAFLARAASSLPLAAGSGPHVWPAWAFIVLAIVVVAAAVGVVFGERKLLRRGIAWRDSAGGKVRSKEDTTGGDGDAGTSEH